MTAQLPRDLDSDLIRAVIFDSGGHRQSLQWEAEGERVGEWDGNMGGGGEI